MPTTAAGQPRRQQARGRARRQQLTETAAALFASPATLLYHVGTTEGLLRAALEQRDAAGRAAWDALLEPGGLETICRLPTVAEGWERESELGPPVLDPPGREPVARRAARSRARPGERRESGRQSRRLVGMRP